MRFLSNKEKKQLSEVLPRGYQISKKDEIKQKDDIIFRGNEKFLIYQDEMYLPHLCSVDETMYKAVYIDKGAIPFILKGADLMRPGIAKLDKPFEKNNIILIKDENHKKMLAIGFALLSSEEMEQQKEGKSVKIYHYFKDNKF